MSDVVLKVENVSKQYRLGYVGTGFLKDDLKRWWHQVRGLEDPFLTIGETNDRTNKGTSDYVWALRDINFEVRRGEVLGIIGKNGAGKSTLLKILSKITGPTTGRIKVKGRIASLLEVGTGFHPELTGRENIYLNGAILGMSKAEIRKKFDEIVDFAGVERYIDTPVKRYSSGMYVRLAFAVAAHLEPDILIVDEVLAVGDAEFQKKAIGKMKEVSEGGGRTVLFVSHNMNSVQKICHKSIMLKNGDIQLSGLTHEVIQGYLQKHIPKREFAKTLINPKHPFVTKGKIEVVGNTCEPMLKISLILKSNVQDQISIDFRLVDGRGMPVGFGSLGGLNYDKQLTLKVGENNISVIIDIKNFANGKYFLCIDIAKPMIEYYDRNENCLSFDIDRVSNLKWSRILRQSWGYGSIEVPVEIIQNYC